MMEMFTEEETERLNKILSLEVNPFLYGESALGESETLELQLGRTTEKWLFRTHMNLSPDAKKELESVLSPDVPNSVKVFELNEYLERRQVSSAPMWWELDFFEFDRKALWDFVAEQCRRNFGDEHRQLFDLLLQSLNELQEARHVLRVSSVNKTMFSEEEVQSALSVFDRSYPLDFCDYEEAPPGVRSPLQAIQELIGAELADVGSVFSKRWFEFKILDEMAAFEFSLHDEARDSELSKKVAAQMRGYWNRRLMSFGRMVEHYRWKFSYEAAALKGIQSAEVERSRGEKVGKDSNQRRLQRLEALMVEIENLSGLVKQVSEERILAQAWDNLAELRTDTPKTPKIRFQYEVELRSLDEFAPRYRAVFTKDA